MVGEHLTMWTNITKLYFGSIVYDVLRSMHDTARAIRAYISEGRREVLRFRSAGIHITLTGI